MAGLVVDRELALDVAEQRGAEHGLEVGLDQQRPPGVHDLNRVGLVVLARRARMLAVDPVRAARHPGAQLADGLGERRVARVTDDLQRVRQHLDPAQVLGAGVAHRVDQVDQRHLAVARREVVLDVEVEQLRAVDRGVLLAGRRRRCIRAPACCSSSSGTTGRPRAGARSGASAAR